MSEIARTKKELAFANKQLYNKRVQQQKAEGAGPSSSVQGFQDGKAHQGNPTVNFSSELENSMKFIENINMQKKVLENENEELKSRISEMMNERTNTLDQAVTNSSASNLMG